MNEQIKEQLMALEKLRLPVLQAKFAEVTGEKTRSPNKIFLIRRITEALQPTTDNIKATKEKKPEADEPSSDGKTTAPMEAAIIGEKIAKLEVPALQSKYLEVVGRPTSSVNKAYLVWKIRQAQRGKISIGPKKRGERAERIYKILPVRMESALVEKLDEAWQRQGLKNRMELFRRSLQTYLASVGENELAKMMRL